MRGGKCNSISARLLDWQGRPTSLQLGMQQGSEGLQGSPTISTPWRLRQSQKLLSERPLIAPLSDEIVLHFDLVWVVPRIVSSFNVVCAPLVFAAIQGAIANLDILHFSASTSESHGMVHGDNWHLAPGSVCHLHRTTICWDLFGNPLPAQSHRQPALKMRK